MKKLPENTQFEVDDNKMAWVMSLLNDAGEFPIYVLKYITIIAAT